MNYTKGFGINITLKLINKVFQNIFYNQKENIFHLRVLVLLFVIFLVFSLYVFDLLSFDLTNLSIANSFLIIKSAMFL